MISNILLYSGLARVRVQMNINRCNLLGGFWQYLSTFKMHTILRQQLQCKKFPLLTFVPKYNKLHVQEAILFKKKKKNYKIGLNINIQQREKVTKITFIHTMENYAISTKNEGESVYANTGRSLDNAN